MKLVNPQKVESSRMSHFEYLDEKPICSEEGCTRERSTKGMCRYHYGKAYQRRVRGPIRRRFIVCSLVGLSVIEDICNGEKCSDVYKKTGLRGSISRASQMHHEFALSLETAKYARKLRNILDWQTDPAPELVEHYEEIKARSIKTFKDWMEKIHAEDEK